MKIESIPKPPGKRSLIDDQAEYQQGLCSRELHDLRKKYKKALGQLNLADRLVELAQQTIHAYPPLKVKGRAKTKTGQNRTKEAAVLIVSDSHIGKVVHASQTLGFGSYNFKIFADRLFYLEQCVRAWSAEHINAQIDELVIFFLGDMLDGRLDHGNEIVRSMSLFDQFYAGAHCFSQFVRNIAQDFPKVRIHTVTGNHPRFPSLQKKMPTEQRYSNFDHFLYATVKEMIRQQTNVEFQLDNQPFCYTDIKGTKIIGMHGDHLRGGDRQMQIPIHSIARQISGITQLYESKGLTAPHLWLSGHLHRGIELPTIKGEFLVNGGFPGDDNFSLSLSTGGEPTQLFFGIHPSYRKTWEYKVKLAYAPKNKEIPYKLPPKLYESLV